MKTNEYQSILVTGGDELARRAKISSLIDSYGVYPEDVVYLEKEEGATKLKIAQIRSLQTALGIGPNRSARKIGVIHNMQDAPILIQNALLKLIEEPPLGSAIMITAASTAQLLPTILSRCFLFTLTAATAHATSDQKALIADQLRAVRAGTTGFRLAQAELLSVDKATACTWLAAASVSVHTSLIQDCMSSLSSSPALPSSIAARYALVGKLLRAYSVLSSSECNTRLFMENLLLELPKDV